MQRYEHGGDIYSHEDVRLDFSANINPLGMPPAVREAILRHVDEYAAYPDPRCRALRAAIARQEDVPQAQVLCGNGAADLIFRLALAWRPKQALLCAPSFSEYEKAVLLAGGGVRAHMLLEEQGFLPDEGLLESISPSVDMVFLCNPNNPTGRLFPQGLLRQALMRCKENGALLVVDECFLDFTDGASLKPLLRQYGNFVILRAFTKMYAMAGLRLGYLLCADGALMRSVQNCAQSWSVSAVAQVAGLAALGCEGWAEQTRALVGHEREFLRAGMEALGLQVLPGDANFLLIKSGAPLYAPLLAKGILVRSCANFAGLHDRYIRVAVRSREENAQLLYALKEVLHG